MQSCGSVEVSHGKIRVRPEEVIARMGTRYVYLTSAWVLAGLLRYLQNMIVFGLSGSPTKSLVKDHFIQFCVLGWIASFFVIIYL